MNAASDMPQEAQNSSPPFATRSIKLGVPYIGTMMDIVVLSAALSILNSGLYSTGRILRSLSLGGSAPAFLAKMSGQSVPYADKQESSLN